MTAQRLAIEYVNTLDVFPNAYNPNVHNALSFDLLTTSLREFGFTQPIVVNRRNMEIVDGENRWRVACVLKMDQIPVCFVDMTDEQCRAATILHNRARGQELSAQIAEVEAALSDDARKTLLLSGRT